MLRDRCVLLAERTADDSGKNRGGGLWCYVNKAWCTVNNIIDRAPSFIYIAPQSSTSVLTRIISCSFRKEDTAVPKHDVTIGNAFT